MDRVVAQDAWKSYRCEELTLLQYSTNDSLFVNDFQKENLIEIAETCSNTDCPTADKIFVSRRSVHETYRALLNEDELCQALIDIGFVVVEPQHLTFQEQIRLFNNAKLVVGLGGAGMFNVAFCQPGTPVVSIESSAAFVSHHADLFSSLGHPYGVILGAKDLTDPTPIHYRWTVDVPAVLDVLRIYL
jgi:capsular polysaccharide biosynthesis protein